MSRALLVVRTLRKNIHLLERQTDLAAHIFPAVQGRDVAVARVIVRAHGRPARLVQLKQIKLAFRPDLAGISHFRRFQHGLFQDVPPVSLKRPPIRMTDIAEKAHNPPV